MKDGYGPSFPDALVSATGTRRHGNLVWRMSYYDYCRRFSQWRHL